MQETETKLIVVARPLAPLWRALGALTHLGEFGLSVLPAQTLEDTYYDTVDGRLRQHDLALRVRYTAGDCTIALKGQSRHAGNVVTRLELERPYSPQALAEIRREMDRYDAGRGERHVPADGTPEQALAACGLEPWQVRVTSRERREIRRRPAGTPAAELALDVCRFYINEHQVLHYEIEIESADGVSIDEVESMATALMALFGAGLRPWRHSKVATHAALAALTKVQGLDSLVDAEALLAAEVYPAIERFLARQQFP